MTDIDNILTIVKTARANVDKDLYAPLTMYQAAQLANEIERLRGLNESLCEQKDESAQDWYLISLRDEFAKAAMTAVLSNPVYAEWDDETLSKSCWSLVDAMMKERSK
jgi:hypothetical protein